MDNSFFLSFAPLAHADLGAWVRVAGFPYARALHIIGSCLIVGVIMLLDLRVIGLFARSPLRYLHRICLPLVSIGLVMALISGYALFSAQPEQMLINSAFQRKLLLLPAVLANAALFETFWIAGGSAQHASPNLLFKISSAASFIGWSGVILCAAWIPYA